MARKVTFHKGTLQQRLETFKQLKSMGYKNGRCAGPYTIDFDASDDSRTFYLDSDFTPSSRWCWIDESEYNGGLYRHKGWFCNEEQDETVRGLVFRLPHGRYLAACSLGKGMVSVVSKEIFYAEFMAIRAADNMAEKLAEQWLEDAVKLREEEEERQIMAMLSEPGTGAIRQAFQVYA